MLIIALRMRANAFLSVKTLFSCSFSSLIVLLVYNNPMAMLRQNKMQLYFLSFCHTQLELLFCFEFLFCGNLYFVFVEMFDLLSRGAS